MKSDLKPIPEKQPISLKSQEIEQDLNLDSSDDEYQNTTAPNIDDDFQEDKVILHSSNQV